MAIFDLFYIPIIDILIALLIIVALFSVRIANQWDRAIVLRLGKFHAIKGPGLFLIIPIIDRITQKVSLQVKVTDIKAEKSLTKDTVPVDVKAVLFWRVIDPRASVVEVTDYNASINRAAQVVLREGIGASTFSELNSSRDVVDERLRTSIAKKTVGWGIEITAVDIQDVEIERETAVVKEMEHHAV